MGSFHQGDIVDVDTFRGVHRDFYKGIYVPAGLDTAVSIRFRPHPNHVWGYADRWVEVGRTLDYTGQGSPPQHQEWNRFNQGLKNAMEARSPVHVFEVLSGNPTTYKYWGKMLVVRWYERLVPEQGRRVLRFVFEIPD